MRKIIDAPSVTNDTYKLLIKYQDFSECGSNGFLIKKSELDKAYNYIMDEKDASNIDTILYKSGICDCDYFYFNKRKYKNDN